jgi:hypothetical protein
MASQFKTAFSLLPLAVLVVAFQNCSPAQFSQSDSTQAKAFGNSSPPSDVVPSDVVPNNMTPGHPPTVVQLPPVPAIDSRDCHNRGDEEVNSHDGMSMPAPSDDATKSYHDVCAQLLNSKQSVQLADGLNIQNNEGAARYIAGSFGHVDGNKGAMALVCKSGGHIASLDNNSGKTIVCGCNIDRIDGHNGAIVIVDGNVGSIENTNGLVLVGGHISPVRRN